jgi:hypothetical protein
LTVRLPWKQQRLARADVDATRFPCAAVLGRNPSGCALCAGCATVSVAVGVLGVSSRVCVDTGAARRSASPCDRDGDEKSPTETADPTLRARRPSDTFVHEPRGLRRCNDGSRRLR